MQLRNGRVDPLEMRDDGLANSREPGASCRADRRPAGCGDGIGIVICDPPETALSGDCP